MRHTVLVHNMVHLWQFVCGEPSRNGYHNTEFSSKMEEIGLNTFSIGKLGGKRTGQSISQNINGDGLFLKAFNKLPEKDFEYHPLPDLEDEKDKIANSTAYQCPNCGSTTWGKPGILEACLPCFELKIPRAGKAGKHAVNENYKMGQEAAKAVLAPDREKWKKRYFKKIKEIQESRDVTRVEDPANTTGKNKEVN